jgi:hypothetical protein
VALPIFFKHKIVDQRYRQDMVKGGSGGLINSF